MRSAFALLAAFPLALGMPHGPDGDMPAAPKPATPSAAVTAPKPAGPAPAIAPTGAVAGKTVTPAGCKALNSDADFPTLAEVRAVLPEAEPRPVPKGFSLGGKRPDYLVRAETVADVQAAVKLAAKRNLRLSVINSGHDFLGRNDAPSGLSLDVSLLGGVRVLESFTPTEKGAEKPGKAPNTIVPVKGKQAAVTFGAGLSTQRLNNLIFPSKLLTMGAAHGSVSVAGGWGQTAGHGPLTPVYGLGVDQFLEFKVVTADGQLRVANKVSNPDLFWALRGGGGGTFGVVVEATVKAYPDIPVTVTTWWMNTTAEEHGLWDAYGYLHTQFPDMVARGISGYYYIYPGAMRAMMVHVGNTTATAAAASFWKPHLEKMASFPGVKPAETQISEYDSFKAYFDSRFGAIDKPACGSVVPAPHKQKRHGPGMEMAAPRPNGAVPLDSRLLGAKHFAHPDLVAAFKATASKGLGGVSMPSLQGHLVAGGKAAHPDDDTAVLPAWRNALVHLIGTRIPGVVSVDSLRKISPDSGAYANEAYYLEENWKETFWGANYPKLSTIKTKYDPDMLFWATPGINADLLEARPDGRVCRVTTPYTRNTPPRSDNSVSALGGAVITNPDSMSGFPKGNGTAKGLQIPPALLSALAKGTGLPKSSGSGNLGALGVPAAVFPTPTGAAAKETACAGGH
ncbi:FAD-binding domain-containing protein [Trichodelitschia bisporula]|uniref:FAD-binding domain-containing protein n=1 Tax=Trichodelitschia bisporula TaxID=703511 RepID=A0A6G1I2G4_9PEZI|nr:FAD-binding domain-containing protein [Trichodelitschia bisporula]